MLVVLFNYFGNRSLWLDEAMLALNLTERSYVGLSEPLRLLQVAPIGFLWAEKAAIELFGDWDWALRLVPLLAYLTALPLCYVLARRMLVGRARAWLAVAVFANAYAANYYATEVKQYMTDGLVAIVILLSCVGFAERLIQGTTAKRSSLAGLGLGLLGVACIWVSNVAVVMLFTTGLYMLYRTWQASPQAFRMTVFPIVVWLMGFVLYYQAFIHDNPNKPGMLDYWEPFGVFLPYNVASVAFWEQLWFKAQVLAKLLCQYRRFSLPLFGFVALGVWAFAKTDRRALYLLVAPIGVHLVLAYLKLYPFEMRMVLYVLPAVSILSAAGLFAAYDWGQRRISRLPVVAIAAVPLLLFGLNVRSASIELEEVKDSLDYLDAHAEAGDRVYVYFQTTAAVKFYLLRHYPGLAQRATFVYGPDGKDDWQIYENHLRAQPAVDWMLFTGPVGLLEAEGYGLMDYFTCVVGEEGFGVTQERHFVGSSVYEFERSRPY